MAQQGKEVNLSSKKKFEFNRGRSQELILGPEQEQMCLEEQQSSCCPTLLTAKILRKRWDTISGLECLAQVCF